jgi:hypothetical protein
VLLPQTVYIDKKRENKIKGSGTRPKPPQPLQNLKLGLPVLLSLKLSVMTCGSSYQMVKLSIIRPIFTSPSAQRFPSL